jgi:vancomycin resistance protein YoaR
MIKWPKSVILLTMSEQFDTHRHYLAAILGTALVVIVVAVIGFSVVYAGKIYPGVSIDGVYVGGLDRAGAIVAIQNQASSYAKQQLTIQNGATALHIPISSLQLQYGDQGVDNALKWGRQGSVAVQIRERIRALFDRPTTFSSYTYSDAQLLPIVAQLDTAAAQPVANASLNVSTGRVGVTAAQPGRRLDRGLLIFNLEQQLAVMGTAPVTPTVYSITPTIDTAALASTQTQAEAYASAPITLQIGGTSQAIDRSTILSWLDVTTPTRVSDLPLDPLTSFYTVPLPPTVNLTLNQTDVGAYVQALATRLDQPAQDAVLAWQNNALAVVKPSQPGEAFDQTKAVQQIVAAASQPSTSRTVTIAATTTQAAVNENNLASLGINTLISSGNTTFPGSSAARIVNVTVGADKFNDVLLSPGQEFSFGQILGPVGAAQGYLPGLVILGNEETYQYGGGLCQVATTAFRAALLAGLPINERSNHSYAVSYYTAPYGVPGVDATIYYPQVDLKFTNDTGHYILIQTSLSGDSLTFDFYGTKTKTGVIIPPHFIYGTTDATKPSETQFQRQVLDLNGNVIKTDTFTQYYQSSTNFPIEQTSNGA